MADTAGFFLDDNNNVVYVDAQGFEYYPNPQLDPAFADAYGIKYVRCDEGKYYFQSAATEAVMRASQQGYEVQYQAPRDSRSGGALDYAGENYAYQQQAYPQQEYPQQEYPQQDPGANDYYSGESYGYPQEDPSALNYQQTENYAYPQEDPSAVDYKEENYGYTQEDPTARMSSSDEEDTRRGAPSNASASDPVPRVSSSAAMSSRGSSNDLNDISRGDGPHGHRKRESKSTTKGKKPNAIRRTKSGSSGCLPKASSASSKSGQPSRSKSGGLLHLVEAAMNANTPQELDEKDFENALKRESNRRKKSNNPSKKSRSVSPTRRKKSDGRKKSEGDQDKKPSRKKSEGDHDIKPGRKASNGELSKKGKKGPALSRSRSTGENRQEKSKRGPRAMSATRSTSRRNLMADRPEPEKSRRGPRALSGSPARSASRRNLMIEPKNSEEEDETLLRGWDANSGSDETLLRGWASNSGNSGSDATMLRGWDAGPEAVRNVSQRNLMVNPREDEEDTQQFMGRAAAPRHASASPKRGGRPALGNCRRVGMLSGARGARNSQRNLFRKHYNAAVNHHALAKEEEEEQIKEQAAMERIKELEAQLAQVQHQQSQPVEQTMGLSHDESPSRHTSPSNSAKDGLMGLRNAAMLVGMTAVNTTMGAGKLVANVGSATTHLAADATMLVGKTAVNTTVGAAKLTANVGMATTHLAADATMLVGKTAVNTTVGAAKLTANVGMATTHLAADATMLVGKTAVNTTVGAAKLTANVGMATAGAAVNTTVGAAKLTANVGMATADAVNNTVGAVAGATPGFGNSPRNSPSHSPERPKKLISLGRSTSNSERTSNKNPMAAIGSMLSCSPERPKMITRIGRSISNSSERTSDKKLPMSAFEGLSDDWISSSIELDGSGQSGTKVL